MALPSPQVIKTNYPTEPQNILPPSPQAPVTSETLTFSGANLGQNVEEEGQEGEKTAAAQQWQKLTLAGGGLRPRDGVKAPTRTLLLDSHSLEGRHFFFFFFPVAPHSLWGLSSLSSILCSGSAEP